MKNIDNIFKDDIRTYGRQLDFRIKINNEQKSTDDFYYIKPSFHTDLFKTVMHELEIDSKNELKEKTKINIEAGLKVNGPYQYINYNTYSVKECNRQEDTLSYIVKAYDKMLESMIDYDLEITEKIPLRTYLLRICSRLGWSTTHIPNTFVNSNKIVDPNLHRGIGYTFRDVLDEIATITCSFLLFINDEFYLTYPTETNEIIDESYLDEDNITIGERYFINSLVFSRAEEGDNIYRKNNYSIERYGLHEYKISDNQLLSTNDRDLYIDEMFEYLKDFEFYIFDVQSKGILFLEAVDKFSFLLAGKTYATILLNNDITYDDGIFETLYTDKPEETETDYKYADTTDKRINQTYILVDKQNQKITQQANQITEYEDKLTKVEQDVNNIKQQVSNTIEYKREVEGITQIHLQEAGQLNILKLEVKGNKTYESNLYLEENLYPGENLYLNQEVL